MQHQVTEAAPRLSVSQTQLLTLTELCEYAVIPLMTDQSEVRWLQAEGQGPVELPQQDMQRTGRNQHGVNWLAVCVSMLPRPSAKDNSITHAFIQ